MLRRRWFSWGLFSALTFSACGGSDDGGLFGFIDGDNDPKGGTVSSVDPSLGETGGRGGAAGGRSSTSKGGSSSSTGGRTSSGTGSSTASGGRSSTAAGGSNSSGGRRSSSGGTVTGVGGEVEGGETFTGGGADAGGTAGETGGAGGDMSSTGGTTGGTNTGGTHTGGTNTGGTNTGGSTTGGQSGNAACEEARQVMEQALEKAQRCDPSEGAEACSGALHNDCGCGVPVNDPDSPAGEAYSKAVSRVVERCGTTPCLVCPVYSAFVCLGDPSTDTDDEPTGHCEGQPIIPIDQD